MGTFLTIFILGWVFFSILFFFAVYYISNNGYSIVNVQNRNLRAALSTIFLILVFFPLLFIIFIESLEYGFNKFVNEWKVYKKYHEENKRYK